MTPAAKRDELAPLSAEDAGGSSAMPRDLFRPMTEMTAQQYSRWSSADRITYARQLGRGRQPVAFGTSTQEGRADEAPKRARTVIVGGPYGPRYE